MIIGTFGLYATLINFGPFALDQYKQNAQSLAKQTPPLAINSTSAEYESIRNVTTAGRDHSKTLGIASEIFVVSLPRRADRRDKMEILRVALDLRWMYVDAVESTGTVVENIMTRIIMLRGMETSRRKDVGNFQWPQNIDALSSSSQPLGLEGSDLWTQSLSTNDTDTQLETASITGNSSAMSAASPEKLTCAYEDNIIRPFRLGLPGYKLLTPAKFACWNSHLSVIRRIAEGHHKTHTTRDPDVSVILEDDVDMEWDIRERLVDIWPMLPPGWDIVFLGTWRRISNIPCSITLPSCWMG